MSVVVTGMKVICEGFCPYTGVGVFYHLLGSLVIAQLKLVRGDVSLLLGHIGNSCY